jgi:uncharacterized protein (TIGR00304 family)
MDKASLLTVLGGVSIAGGVASIGAAAAAGDVDLSFVLIFPVLSGGGALFAVGALLLFLGMLLAFLGLSLRSMTRMVDDEGPTATQERRPRPGEGTSIGSVLGAPAGSSSFGGVVFVGPIPIVFGFNPRMNRLMVVAAVVMALLFFTFLIGAML